MFFVIHCDCFKGPQASTELFLSNMVHIIVPILYDWKITAYFIYYMHIYNVLNIWNI